MSALTVEEAIELSRTVDHKHAVPGRAVTVTLTVENVSDRPVPEVRVVDGVPTDLSVVTGSPRLATGLRAGGSATTSYTVRVQHGTHAF
ncbi:NEW3 domain-containing protein, partial [Salmonella enterica]|uniref:NEW3 domain-containing protein n=1 Tax=Salmonella enterica TaxID=28901 RepID=UPI0039EB0A5A